MKRALPKATLFLTVAMMPGTLLAAGPAPGPASLPPGNPPADADITELQRQIAAERATIAAQRVQLDAQMQRLDALEDALLGKMRAMGLPPAMMAQTPVQFVQQQQPPAQDNVTSVGQKPEAVRPADVAVLADQGGIISSAGRLTLEPGFEYARIDRNRFVFRGIEIPQSVLVGVFDINETRQDILTASATVRYGLSSRFELSARVPWVYRKDTAVLVPLVQNPPQSGAGTVNVSADGTGLGDIELQGRYQVTNGTGGWPYLVAGVQVIVPTGSSPFGLPRDPLGNARKAATGAGFWGVQPSVTLLLPSDPATLFGVLGYTFNFGRSVDTRISDAQIDHVKPGGAPNAAFGLGLGLNERLSLSLGYAHTWQMATKSTVRPILIRNGITEIGDPITTKTRDLQIGRLLFGLSYRATDRTTINWSVEVGATDDAADLRTSLRVPISLN